MSQSDMILAHLKRHNSITAVQALGRYGVFRLAARIGDLRDKGYIIETETIHRDKKHYARYWLA